MKYASSKLKLAKSVYEPTPRILPWIANNLCQRLFRDHRIDVRNVNGFCFFEAASYLGCVYADVDQRGSARDLPKVSVSILERLSDSASALAAQCIAAGVNGELYRRLADVAALFKKYETPEDFGRSGSQPAATAVATWCEAESACESWSYFQSDVKGSELRAMRHYVRSIVGSTPPMKRIYESCYWNSGASLWCGGERTHVAAKADALMVSVSPSVYSLATHALAAGRFYKGHPYAARSEDLDAPPWNEFVARWRFVPYNKLWFVPKTISTHRAIAIEPTLNSLVQSGIDTVLRNALLSKARLDLRDQATNRHLAYEGSVTGSLATIDLSSASDMLSYELIKAILPPLWFGLLDDARMPFTLVPKEFIDFFDPQFIADRKIDETAEGIVIRIHKFASMGNNFCFPLQTLVFLAVCAACECDMDRVRVYGDDIIVPSEKYDSVLSLLKRIGSKPNPSKSFGTGPFRESCGADWWNGRDVRPTYAKKTWSSVQNFMSWHNNYAKTHNDEEDLEMLAKARSFIPLRLRLLQPEGYESSSGAFTVPLDVAMTCSTVVWDRAAQGWTWMRIQESPIADKSVSVNHFMYYLDRLRAIGSANGSSIRDGLISKKDDAHLRNGGDTLSQESASLHPFFRRKTRTRFIWTAPRG